MRPPQVTATLEISTRPGDDTKVEKAGREHEEPRGVLKHDTVVSDSAACRVGRRRQRSFLSTSCLLPIYAPQISTNASTNTVPMRVLAKFSQYGVEITLNTARLQPCVHHSIVAGWPSGSVNFRGTESASLIIVFRVSDKLKCKYLLRWNLQCGAN
jgi:hypothetical protein